MSLKDAGMTGVNLPQPALVRLILYWTRRYLFSDRIARKPPMISPTVAS